MATEPVRIGLALSGGGVRATVFHLGVLARLAEADLWNGMTHVSTVSGGSLCIALVFAKSGAKWPTASEYLERTLPEARDVLTTKSLQWRLCIRTIARFWRLFSGRARILSRLLRKHWGVTSDVSQMPLMPRWTINTTCYETGKSFRFSAKRMGDYVTQYVLNPRFRLSDAVAASAGFPVGIGPLGICTRRYVWQTHDGAETVRPLYCSYHLWDGGVYENLGIEALYKIGEDEGLRDDIDFCLVSDASAPLQNARRPCVPIVRHALQAKRLIDIPTEQTRSIRARDLFGHFRDHKCGGYIRIGESVAEVLKKHKVVGTSEGLLDKALSETAVSDAAKFPTTLRRLTPAEFGLLFRHGYETCDAVLQGTGRASLAGWDAATWDALWLSAKA